MPPTNTRPTRGGKRPAKTTGGRDRRATGRAAASGKRRRAPAGPVLPSVANHPRAGVQIARAKGWGGLVGFALAAFLSYEANVPLPETALRALAGGIAAYLVVWACAVAVWRHLVVTELRVVREQREQEAAARAATAAAAAVAEQVDGGENGER